MNTHEKINQNGGDGSNDGPGQTHPTICQVLQEAATLNRYIDELDDPIGQKLETTLGSFKQLCLNSAKCAKYICNEYRLCFSKNFEFIFRATL
jgi:hypothetical protein